MTPPEHALAEAVRLVQCLIDNEPDDTVADGGVTCLMVWRQDAQRWLAALPTGESRQGEERLTPGLGCCRHELKTWPEFFWQVKGGAKPFEIRRDDRPYQVGDVLQLDEWSEDGGYTSQSIDRRVTYTLRDAPLFGLADGFVLMGLAAAPTPPETAEARLRAAWFAGLRFGCPNTSPDPASIANTELRCAADIAALTDTPALKAEDRP